MKWGLLLFAILGVTVYIFDTITKCDYFFFYDGHTFPVFDFISKNVPPIVWTLIVTTCYVLTGIMFHYLIIGIKYLIHKKNLITLINNIERASHQSGVHLCSSDGWFITSKSR